MRSTTDLICDYCGNEFLREARYVRKNIKRGIAKVYCSRSCRGKGMMVTRDQTGDKNPNWKGGITCSESVMASRRKHPERKLARDAIYRAIKKGKIKRPKKCEGCNKEGPVTAHHEDYLKRMEVLWLCDPCHQKADKLLSDKNKK